MLKVATTGRSTTERGTILESGTMESEGTECQLLITYTDTAGKYHALDTIKGKAVFVKIITETETEQSKQFAPLKF